MIYKFYKCAPELMKASQSRHEGQHFKEEHRTPPRFPVFSLHALSSRAGPTGLADTAYGPWWETPGGPVVSRGLHAGWKGRAHKTGPSLQEAGG